MIGFFFAESCGYQEQPVLHRGLFSPQKRSLDIQDAGTLPRCHRISLLVSELVLIFESPRKDSGDRSLVELHNNASIRVQPTA